MDRPNALSLGDIAPPGSGAETGCAASRRNPCEPGACRSNTACKAAVADLVPDTRRPHVEFACRAAADIGDCLRLLRECSQIDEVDSAVLQMVHQRAYSLAMAAFEALDSSPRPLSELWLELYPTAPNPWQLQAGARP